jgi:hypothetical protein
MWIIANTESSGPAPRGAICYHQHLFLQKPLHTVIEDKDSTSQGARHRCLLQLWWWLLLEILTTPPRGLPSTSSSTSMVAAAGDTGSTPRGAAIDVFFNFGGGCCQKYRQHPSGGPPSTSSPASVVPAAGDTGSTSQGGCHRRLLQPRWWLMPEIPAAPP